jgi:hypothetical protein
MQKNDAIVEKILKADDNTVSVTKKRYHLGIVTDEFIKRETIEKIIDNLDTEELAEEFLREVSFWSYSSDVEVSAVIDCTNAKISILSGLNFPYDIYKYVILDSCKCNWFWDFDKTDLLTDEEKEESLKNFKEKYNLEEDDFDEFDAFREYLESDKIDIVERAVKYHLCNFYIKDDLKEQLDNIYDESSNELSELNYL